MLVNDVLELMPLQQSILSWKQVVHFIEWLIFAAHEVVRVPDASRGRRTSRSGTPLRCGSITSFAARRSTSTRVLSQRRDNIALLPDRQHHQEVTILQQRQLRHQCPENFIGNDMSSKLGVQYPSVEADRIPTKLAPRRTPNAECRAPDVKVVIANIADRILGNWVLIEEGSFVFRDASLSTLEPTAKPSTDAPVSAAPASS